MFEESPVAAGVVGSVDRRSKELWENRFLVFPQLRHFPQRFRPPNFHLRCWRSGKPRKSAPGVSLGLGPDSTTQPLKELSDGYRSTQKPSTEVDASSSK